MCLFTTWVTYIFSHSLSLIIQYQGSLCKEDEHRSTPAHWTLYCMKDEFDCFDFKEATSDWIEMMFEKWFPFSVCSEFFMTFGSNMGSSVPGFFWPCWQTKILLTMFSALFLNLHCWDKESLIMYYSCSLSGNSVASALRFGNALRDKSWSTHVKSIQGVIGTSERVTSRTRRL